MALSVTAKLEVLSELARTIADRRSAPTDQSYSAGLMAGGLEKCAKKTGEEAVEFVIAAVTGNHKETAKEAADLLYHLLVTLEVSGVSLDEVLDELKSRRGISGLEEKASRPQT